MATPCGALVQNENSDNDEVIFATRRIGLVVAATFRVPIGEIHGGSRRTAPVALARQSAMYLAHVTLGLSFTEAGRAFGRARTTAARACRAIEDRREERRLDSALADLERALRHDFGARLGAGS